MTVQDIRTLVDDKKEVKKFLAIIQSHIIETGKITVDGLPMNVYSAQQVMEKMRELSLAANENDKDHLFNIYYNNYLITKQLIENGVE